MRKWNKETRRVLALVFLAIALPLLSFSILAPSLFPQSVGRNTLSFQVADFDSGLFGIEQVQLGLLKLKFVDEVLAYESQPARVIQVDRGASYATVDADSWLDPAEKTAFLLSFFVKFERLPREGMRHSIVSKFDGRNKPFPGWSIALKRRKTSLRPEVYLRSSEGKGGWFVFDSYPFETEHWYILSVVIVPEGYISFYVQHVGSQAQIATQKDQQMQQVVFAGGYPTEELKAPFTVAPLVLGARRRAEKAFLGEVAQVLVAGPKDLPRNINETKELLNGGGPYIVSRLENDEVFLWIGEQGKDQSQFGRTIRFSGKASWYET